MCNIHASDIRKNMFQLLKIIHSSMNKQYMKGVQNIKWLIVKRM